MPAALIRLCASTPLDSSQHTLFPCVSPLPINLRPLTLKQRAGIISQASRPARRDAAEYQCVLSVGHVYPPIPLQPVSLTALPGYRTWRSAHCARQQQLHLSVIQSWKQWLAYNMHNKVTLGSLLMIADRDNA